MVKILVIDDSESVRTQLKNDLVAGGYGVIEAEDGLQGIKQVEDNGDIQLIICDVNMPNMDGLTMMEKIQGPIQEKRFSVFMLTTETTAQMKEKAKELGVRAWITKPYVAEKLLKAVEKVTSSHG